jgi:hypothetical protein
MFRNVCSCNNPAPISFDTSNPLPELENVPVLIIAANRPKYLFRSLSSILNAHGVHIKNIIVSIDGFYSDSAAVAGKNCNSIPGVNYGNFNFLNEGSIKTGKTSRVKFQWENINQQIFL